MKSLLAYLWKLPLCGLAFFIGMILGGILLPLLGFTSPEMPAGTDAGTVTLWFLLGSMLLAAFLAQISGHLHTRWWVRWTILSFFTWIFLAVGMVLESFLFMTTGAVSSLENSLFTMLNFLAPTLFLSGMVTSLFRPAVGATTRPRFAVQSPKDWLWRIMLALLAYPLIYFAFGLLVQPFISDFYTTGQYELTIPTWGQMIPLQLVRSLLFLLASLPVIGFWGGSRRILWLSLGLTIFACTGFMAVITAYWFPWQLRLFHGLELLADALLYAAALIWLFAHPSRKIKQTYPTDQVQISPVG